MKIERQRLIIHHKFKIFIRTVNFNNKYCFSSKISRKEFDVDDHSRGWSITSSQKYSSNTTLDGAEN